MANWDDITSIGDVEDRRGTTPALAFAGGGGIVVLLLTLGLNYLGLNVSPDAVSSVMDALGTSKVDFQPQPAEFAGKDGYEVFASKVLGSTNDVWSGVFTKNGVAYQKPKLVLFRNATQTGCGLASSSVGPFYCANDQTLYLDETFFNELKTRFGADTGDVAQAYVIAHEVGHHVQNQLGVFEQTDTQSRYGSIETELQADCYAGVWAYAVNKNRIFANGEINQATSAAAAVGDDNIQSKIEGRVSPETWTHGSSAQRVNAFNVGYNTGQPGRCVNLAR